MPTMKITNGEFEAKLEQEESGHVNISFKVPPKNTDTFDCEDFAFLVDFIYGLSKNPKFSVDTGSIVRYSDNISQGEKNV